MQEVIIHEWKTRVVLIFFIVMSVWWGLLFISHSEGFYNLLFAAIYGLVCLWGSYWGLRSAQRWGGFSSVIGRALIVLSLGLFLQEFGQLVFSYYNIFLNIEVPYPSLADVGFFGSVLLYIYGIFLLARASGTKFSLQQTSNKIQVVAIPLILIGLAYFFFLKGHTYEWSNLFKIILDVGYPVGEAIYISIALLTLSLSRKLLGGIMRGSILFIIVAFCFQFLADFNFLYQNSHDTWMNGGYGDYLYFIAYLLMTLGLIKMRLVFSKLEAG